MICDENRQLNGDPVSIQEPAFLVRATRLRLRAFRASLSLFRGSGKSASLLCPWGWAAARLLCLAFKACDGTPAEPAFDLFDRADDQLITWLGLRRIDRMGRQLKYACCLNPQRRNPESGEMLDNVDDAMVLVQVDQIKGKENAQCMNSLRRYYPQSFVKFELQSSDQPLESRKDSVCRGDPQAKEAFASLVIYAVRSSIHWSQLFRGLEQ
jgi:hypothetical protein